MRTLDRSRPYGKLFIGPETYFGQDDMGFDMATGALVVDLLTPEQRAAKYATPAAVPVSGAVPPVPDPEPQGAPPATGKQTLTCKVVGCTQTFPLWKSEAGRKSIMGKIRKHLKEAHGIEA